MNTYFTSPLTTDPVDAVMAAQAEESEAFAAKLEALAAELNPDDDIAGVLAGRLRTSATVVRAWARQPKPSL